jgi:hypothetical protein
MPLHLSGYFTVRSLAVCSGMDATRWRACRVSHAGYMRHGTWWWSPTQGLSSAWSEDKVEALAGAHRVLAVTSELAAFVEEEPPEQLKMWPDWEEATLQVQPLKPVSRRRRDIFEKASGKCHYCGTVLSLHGQWHVEHMMPRALGGDIFLILLPSRYMSHWGKGLTQPLHRASNEQRASHLRG